MFQLSGLCYNIMKLEFKRCVYMYLDFTCIYTYIHIHMCVYIYIYMYLHIYTHVYSYMKSLAIVSPL